MVAVTRVDSLYLGRLRGASTVMSSKCEEVLKEERWLGTSTVVPA